MRWWLPAVALALMLQALGAADDAPRASPAAPAALSVEQVADAVVGAIEGHGGAGLKALAERELPDTWLVADELLWRGQREAALALARSSTIPALRQLAAYVAAWQPQPQDGERRARLQRANAALVGRQFQQALDALDATPEPVADDVLGVRLATGRGLAWRGLGRWREVIEPMRLAAEGAERIGWATRAGWVLHELGFAAYEVSELVVARDAYRRAVSSKESLGDTAGAATSLGNLANVLGSLGALVDARDMHAEALRRKEAVGDRAGAAMSRASLGWLHHRLGGDEQALDALTAALAAHRVLQDEANEAVDLAMLGSVHQSRGEFERAVVEQRQALAIQERLGDRRRAANTLGDLGVTHHLMGRYAEALSLHEQALARKLELDDRYGASITLANVGAVRMDLGAYAAALEALEQAQAQQLALGDRLGAAQTLGSIAALHFATGSYAKSLMAAERAIADMRALGFKSGVATNLGNQGNTLQALGEFARASAAQEESLRLKEELGDKVGVALTINNMANLHGALGEPERALAGYRRALDLQLEAGARGAAALTLGNLGAAYSSLGRYEEALDALERALEQKLELGDRGGAAMVHSNIGNVHLQQGDASAARQAFTSALGLLESLGTQGDLALVLQNLAVVERLEGHVPQARSLAERAVRVARSTRARPRLLSALQELARIHLLADEPGRALGVVQMALGELEQLLSGLGEEEGASGRGVHSDLFGIGALAASRDADGAETMRFLESGRAGALLDTLDKREVLRWKAETLSPGLLAADQRARASQRIARQAYDRELAGDDRKLRAAAARALDEATEDVRSVQVRIEREVKRAEGLYYPRAKSLEEIQAALEDGEALVLYGLCLDEALALVVEPAGKRIVMLGKRAEIEAACEALRAFDLDVDPAPALAALRELLLAPLALDPAGKRALISPEGPLCFVPWGALLDVPVAVTPSGSTHALLRDEEREPGMGVLALGDPDYAGVSAGAQAIYYRGKQLKPLPATKAEAERVGTVALVGAQASEEGLRAALAKQPRWRAVHFACHGLIDPKRPTLSSLALSRSDDDDGFLTALEVLRMQIPADLAVLSACATGTGKLVGGEGIVGLTRAFMYAGASRVLCSLWKVDDEATAALMQAFYAAWNPKDGVPGVSAAEALRRAQANVRSREKWKHPYYWAAWVLWGLP